MSYYFNKIVMAVLDPLMVGILLALAGIVLLACRWRKMGLFIGLVGVAWLWVMGCGLTREALGCHLEGMCPPMPIEQVPKADAIILLGGGMSAAPNVSPFAEMHAAADRVWQAARLYKAGKAPVIIPSGAGEDMATVPLLLDLGVPRDAIRVENAARNTEENAKFVQYLLLSQSPNRTISQSNNPSIEQSNNPRPKALLVTSAWHMRRSLLMYRRYAPGLEIVPVGCDYEATLAHASPAPGNFPKIHPESEPLQWSQVYFKEFIGYWGYRLLRR